MAHDDDPSKTGSGSEGNASDDTIKKSDIEALVSATVNKAITGHLKRELKSLPQLIKSALAESAAAPKTEGDEGVSDDAGDEQPKPKTPAKTPKAAGAKTGSEERAEPSAEAVRLAELEKRFEKQEKALKDANAATARERRRAADERGLATVRGEFTKLLRPDAVDLVTDAMRARGAFVIDDEGNVRMKVRASLEQGMPVEEHELPFHEALPHFLKTKDAALFLPPPNRGAGDRKGAFERDGRQPTTRQAPRRTDADESNALVDHVEQLTGKSLDELL